MPFTGQAQTRNAQRPPNIILILIDDFGWADLGCYGSTFHQTPNVDALARRGVRFTNAYAAASICSPTRASLMTGKAPARLHLTDWLPGRPDRPDQKLARPVIEQQLPLSEVTLAEALKQRGYVTGHIGKWHLGGTGFSPLEQGFDVNIAGAGQAGRVNDMPVISTDLYPTILALAGAPVPIGLDGLSLASLVKTGSAPRRDALHWHYPHYSNQGGKPGGAIRAGEWKLIEFYEDNRAELYNLRQDVSETTDLAAKFPARVKTMRAQLARWRKQVNAQMMTPNPNYQGPNTAR